MEFLTPSRGQGSREERKGKAGEEEITVVEGEATNMELEGEGAVGETGMVRKGEETLVDIVGVVKNVVGTRNGELLKSLCE